MICPICKENSYVVKTQFSPILGRNIVLAAYCSNCNYTVDEEAVSSVCPRCRKLYCKCK